MALNGTSILDITKTLNGEGVSSPECMIAMRFPA